MSLLNSVNVKTYQKSIPIDMSIIGVFVPNSYDTLSDDSDKYVEVSVNNKNIFNKPIPFLHLKKVSEYPYELAKVKKGDSIELTLINYTGQAVVMGKTKDNSLYCLVFG